jgi:two-component system KDP operon response regulator KdpE
MRKVLLLDDEPEITRLVVLCLAPLGVDVVRAADLTGALALARSEDIGLVLLDLALGNEDGLDILPGLRSEPRLADVPVVAFTAHDSRRREAFERGADAFLARPFEAADLTAAVELLLVR